MNFCVFIFVVLISISSSNIYNWAFADTECTESKWITITELPECANFGSIHRKTVCINNQIQMSECSDNQCSNCRRVDEFPANKCENQRKYVCENRVPQLNENGFILSSFRGSHCSGEINLKTYHSGNCDTSRNLRSYCEKSTKTARFVKTFPNTNCRQEKELEKSLKNGYCVSQGVKNEMVTKCGE